MPQEEQEACQSSIVLKAPKKLATKHPAASIRDPANAAVPTSLPVPAARWATPARARAKTQHKRDNARGTHHAAGVVAKGC